jgi:hypothetical protein
MACAHHVVIAFARACSTWCTRLVPASRCLFAKQATLHRFGVSRRLGAFGLLEAVLRVTHGGIATVG